MPKSLANVLLHVIFSTKHRQPFLQAGADRDTITAYIIGTLQNGAFSVSQSNAPEVKRYIANQEEYRLFLEKHGIEYDERYVWD